MPNIIADSCIHKPVCFQPGGGGCVSKCRHWLAVENGNSIQQLKAEIAALIADYRSCQHSSEFQKKFESRIETLRQLSAV